MEPLLMGGSHYHSCFHATFLLSRIFVKFFQPNPNIFTLVSILSTESSDGLKSLRKHKITDQYQLLQKLPAFGLKSILTYPAEKNQSIEYDSHKQTTLVLVISLSFELLDSSFQNTGSRVRPRIKKTLLAFIQN